MLKAINLLGSLAATAALAGCSGKEGTPVPAVPAAPTTTSAPVPAVAALGAQQVAGHIELTLTTEPEAPKAGDVTLRCQVGHHGQPHPGATVKIDLTGPGAGADMPEVALLQTTMGTYEGKAKLTEGTWEAKISVNDGHDSQVFAYKFEVAK
jgi:hypothetical protein